jgi:hypothetical protein
MDKSYGRRKDDFVNMLPPIEIPNMTDSQKILNILRDGLISHDTRLQNMRNDMNDQGTDIEVLKKVVLTGDGGILSHAERIRKLEGFIDKLEESLKYWGRLIGGALLLNFLGFITGIIIALVRFLPILEALAKKP